MAYVPKPNQTLNITKDMFADMDNGNIYSGDCFGSCCFRDFYFCEFFSEVYSFHN